MATVTGRHVVSLGRERDGSHSASGVGEVVGGGNVSDLELLRDKRRARPAQRDASSNSEASPGYDHLARLEAEALRGNILAFAGGHSGEGSEGGVVEL